MFSSHHLLSLVPNRIESAVKRLQRSIWHDSQPLPVEATAFGPEIVSLDEARRRKLAPVCVGSAWGLLYDQRWYRLNFPTVQEGIYLNWRDQGEATLYVDGVPYFGFDPAHRYCLLPSGICEAWVESHCVQSGIWHPEATGLSPEGSRFDGAYLCRRNDHAWNAYHDLKCLFDLLLDARARENPLASPWLNPFGHQLPVEKASPFYRRLLRVLDEAVDVLDSQGISEMSSKLEAVYEELRRDKTLQRCVLTGHAHIDLVWLWPERIGEFKAVHVFSTMNHLMKLYPEFRFAYSQPASYQAVQRRSPGLFASVQDRIREGKWQATGGMYVEADTLIACGEALARGFVLGQEGFMEISGRHSSLTWLPDVFGYAGCLPQLMQLSGIDYFFTTKMTWNSMNRFPLSSFVWRGSDGSEVVAHVSQDVGYVSHVDVGQIKNGMYGHQQADIHQEYLLPTGYGDGGGGPTDEMCERARRLGGMPGMPSMEWDQPEAFFERLADLRGRLPVHQGECYLEYHRGTYTTHGNIKAAFRGLERALQIREAVICATGSGDLPIESWKRMVFAQFHDYIPGSSVPEVYSESLPELTSLGQEEMQAARSALEMKPGNESIFNPLPLPVRRWVKCGGGEDELLVEMPPLSGVAISEAQVQENIKPVVVSNGTLSNGFVKLCIDDSGRITELRCGDREIAIAEPLGSFVLYPDHPANFDAWDIDRQTLSLGTVCDTPCKITQCVQGSHRAILAVSRPVGEHSYATVNYSLDAGSSFIQVEVELDWNEPETLLKMHFPTQYMASSARFGAPFGSVLRPQLPSGRIAEAMWEVPFSRYLAVFDEGEQDGFFIVTESKYGATVWEGNIGLSLVRSPLITGNDAIHLGVRPPQLARLKCTTPYSDIGHHTIRLAIGGYSASAPREQQPAALADILFTEPIMYHGEPVRTAYKGIEGCVSLIPAWAIPSQNGSWVLRLHETGGRRGKARVCLEEGWIATAVDLLGNPMEKDIKLGQFEYRPYEIIGLLITKAEDQAGNRF